MTSLSWPMKTRQNNLQREMALETQTSLDPTLTMNEASQVYEMLASAQCTLWVAILP